jgi:hypothetical protein
MSNAANTINRKTFEVGETGRILPEDFEPGEIYTARLVFADNERSEKEFALDHPVNLEQYRWDRRNQVGLYIATITDVERGADQLDFTNPQELTVLSEGIVIELGLFSPQINRGYFLAGDPLPTDKNAESDIYALVPRQPKKIEVLKQLPL